MNNNIQSEMDSTPSESADKFIVTEKRTVTTVPFQRVSWSTRMNKTIQWSKENPLQATAVVVIGAISFRSKLVKKLALWTATSAATIWLNDTLKK